MNRRIHGWHRHPGVRSGDDLSRGERAADKMRNGMGSWAFVFGAVAFLVVWMGLNVILDKASGHTFDAYPFILLNLVLSCVAALQGAILLIAAKRSDHISSELAQHDYETDQEAKEVLKTLQVDFSAMMRVQAAQDAMLQTLIAQLPGPPKPAEQEPPSDDLRP